MHFTTESEAADFVRGCSEAGAPIELSGGRTLQEVGRPFETARELSSQGYTGITLAAPEELVWSARSGTSMDELRKSLSEARQTLAFEPPNWARLLRRPADRQTIGGIVAANLSGPRRLRAGAARDHVLGARFVDGRGQVLRAGGRVVKNVTGYDLPKLLTGSFGTLGLLSEITLRSMPAPEDSRSVLIRAAHPEAAVAAMASALAGPFEVSAAAFLPGGIAERSPALASYGSDGVVVLRLEGIAPSVDYRCSALLARFSGAQDLAAERSQALWRDIAEVEYFVADDRAVWRVGLPAAVVASTLARWQSQLRFDYFLDWGGALVWLAIDGAEPDASAPCIRSVLPAGHATLIRAPAAVRRRAGVFQPQSPALAALTERVRAVFDPRGIFNPGRLQP